MVLQPKVIQALPWVRHADMRTCGHAVGPQWEAPGRAPLLAQLFDAIEDCCVLSFHSGLGFSDHQKVNLEQLETVGETT